MDKTASILLRLTPAEKKVIESYAKAERRTVTSFILYLVNQAIEDKNFKQINSFSLPSVMPKE